MADATTGVPAENASRQVSPNASGHTDGTTTTSASAIRRRTCCGSSQPVSSTAVPDTELGDAFAQLVEHRAGTADGEGRVGVGGEQGGYGIEEHLRTLEVLEAAGEHDPAAAAVQLRRTGRVRRAPPVRSRWGPPGSG